MTGEPTPEMLPRDGKAYEIYTLTWSAADTLAECLPTAWDRSFNVKGEYLHKAYALEALSQALDLDWCCQQVLADPKLLVPEAGSPEAKYAFQAGIYIAHNILPYSQEERSRLGPAELSIRRNATSLRDRDAASQEPELIERWHEWIWLDTHGRPTSEVSVLGASAILAVAAKRLADSLSSELLGWHIEPPEDIRV